MSSFANECMYGLAMSMSLKLCKGISAAPMFSFVLFYCSDFVFSLQREPERLYEESCRLASRFPTILFPLETKLRLLLDRQMGMALYGRKGGRWWVVGEGNIAGSEPRHGLVILTMKLLRKCVFFPLSLCLFREVFFKYFYIALLKHNTCFFLLINLLPKIVGHVLFEPFGRKVLLYVYILFIICLFLLCFLNQYTQRQVLKMEFYDFFKIT